MSIPCGMGPDRDFQLFALAASRALGEQIATSLGVALTAHEERAFEDGEHKSRPLTSVRGADVYVLQSLFGDGALSVNDKLVQLWFFIGALRDAGAARITALAPILGYARKDRKSQPRDPTTTRYVASLFEAVGVDRVVTLDVHNLAAYQNAFRCSTEHLEATGMFSAHCARLIGANEAAVVSPDAGGIKRAERLRARLARDLGRPVTAAFAEKHRALGVVSGDAFVGDVRGRIAIIIDDLIASGTTLARTAQACVAAGASAVHAVATHGLFVGRANEVLGESALASVVVTDSVPPFRVTGKALGDKLVVLPIAPLLAEAVRRLHRDESLVELLERS